MAKSIYDRLVAGVAASTERDAARTAYMLARDSLDTESVHIIYRFANGQVRYLAIPGELADSGLRTTPLVGALPGHATHQGNGIYLLPASTATAAIVCSDDRFEYIHHETEAIQEYIDQFADLPRYDVATWPHGELEPAIVGARQAMRRVLAQATVVNMAAASIAAIVVTIAITANVMLTKAATTTSANTTRALDAMVNDLVGQTKINDQMQELLTIAAVTTRAGGWLREYEWKAGTSRFAVTMPEWVTRDYVAALGPDVVAEIDREKNVVEFRKGGK